MFKIELPLEYMMTLIACITALYGAYSARRDRLFPVMFVILAMVDLADRSWWYLVFPVTMGVYLYSRGGRAWMVWLVPTVFIVPYLATGEWFGMYKFMLYHELVSIAAGVTAVAMFLRRDIVRTVLFWGILMNWEQFVLSCQPYTIFILRVAVLALLISSTLSGGWRVFFDLEPIADDKKDTHRCATAMAHIATKEVEPMA